MVVVAITGATGLPGFLISKAVLQGENKCTFKAFVRPNTQKHKEIEELKNLGAEVIEVDICNGEEMKKALVGVDKLIDATMNSTQNNILIPQIAKSAGVKHLIWNFGSKFWEIPEGLMPILDDKRKILKSEKESGIIFTHVNTSNFMEYLYSRFSDKDSINILENEVPIAVTHCADIAQFVPKIIFDSAYENKDVDIYSAVFNYSSLIPLLEARTGKKLKVNKYSVEEVRQAIKDDKNKQKSLLFQGLLLNALGPKGFQVNPECDARKLIPQITQFVDPVEFISTYYLGAQ